MIPCAQTPIGSCLAQPQDPLHCARCGKVVNHARTRLALLIAQAPSTLRRLAEQHLDLDAHLAGITAQVTTRRRVWWRP